MSVVEGLTIYGHAHIVAARSEDAADDAGGVRMLATDDGFAAHVVTDFANHGIEAEVANVDAVAVVHLHHIDRVGDTLYQAGNVGEGFESVVIFDIVVAAAVSMDGHLYVGEADDAGDHLVEGAVAATGIESHLFTRMVGAPLAGPSGGIALGVGDVDLIVKVGMLRDIRLHFLGYLGGGVLFPGTGINDEDMFHFL